LQAASNPSFLLHGGGVLQAEKTTGYTPKVAHPGWTGAGD
jgi:hypothetical protein